MVDEEVKDVAAAEGIGYGTAENLLGTFKTPEAVFDASKTIPDWIIDNVKGMGHKNLEKLQRFAADNGFDGYISNKNLASMKAPDIERLGGTHYLCAQFENGLVLFYNLTEYEADPHGFGGWKFPKRWRLMYKHPTYDSEYVTLERGRKEEYYKVFDRFRKRYGIGSKKTKITDRGHVYYARKYSLSDYPDDLGNEKTGEWRSGFKKVGMTHDRIVFYAKGDTVIRGVLDYDREFYRLYGYSRLITDEDIELGYASVQQWVDEWKDTDWKKKSGRWRALAPEYK